MSLFEVPVKSPWSNPGSVQGKLLVAYNSGLGAYPYGGKLIPLLERYAETRPAQKAVCVVLGEINLEQDNANNRLALRPDLTRHMGALVSFGRDMSREPSHYAVDMREHAKTNNDFVGAELAGGFDTTIDLQWSLRPYALREVCLEIAKGVCTLGNSI